MPKTDKPDAVDAALEELRPLNLRDKLCRLRQNIGFIKKEGVAPEKMGKYTYMRAEDVAGELGDAMCLMGISMVPTEVKVVSHQIVEGRASHVVITVQYLIMDMDSDERITVGAAGEGKDFGDKAVPKAMTGALKYALTQMLTMRVGDDAEAADLSEGQNHQPAPKTAPATTPAQQLPPFRPVPTIPASRANQGPVITQKQRNRMFAIAKGDTELIKRVQKSAPWLYDRSDHILMSHYEAICTEIERQKNNPDSQVPIDDEDIPF